MVIFDGCLHPYFTSVSLVMHGLPYDGWMWLVLALLTEFRYE